MMPRPPSAGPAMSERIIAFGQRVEQLGFAGIWVTDSFGRGRPTLDPLLELAALAAVTRQVELGTCILQVPVRHPVELAHRVQSLNVLSNGRLRLGVGSGSTRNDFDVVGADFDGRFKALPEALEAMQQAWRGQAVGGPALSVWPGTQGGPPVLLGAWRSPRWINLAARLQGWIASGIHTKWEDLELGLRMYREAGGKRTVVANIFTDLRPDPEPMELPFQLKIDLRCPPTEAKARLRRLADIGVDDALLVCPFSDPGQLETIRGLY
jgi:alkanesulfonate monooxygenase SsuD/methylene tetrahydromethanopterin reductase-like flavin-dependent oxidoreductase (luciferase family)